MSDALVVLILLAAGTYALKAAGPLVLGSRRLPTRIQLLVDLLPAALLASLAIVSTVGDGEAVVLDAAPRRVGRRRRRALASCSVRGRDRGGVGRHGAGSRCRLSD